MMVVIAADDPRDPRVREVLEAHLAFAHGYTPADHVHALDVDRLVDPAVTFFSARRDGEVLGVGALRRLDDDHAEIKSMHVRAAARGQGIGRMVVDHLVRVAAERGHGRVSLETGTMEAFGPARALYAQVGFAPCPPFAEYTANPYSMCMALVLDPPPDGTPVTSAARQR